MIQLHWVIVVRELVICMNTSIVIDQLDPSTNPDQICAANNCDCPVSDRLSNTDNDNTPGYDTVSLSSGYTLTPEDTINFPTDLFAYVTGTAESNWQIKKDEIDANGGHIECNALDASSTGNRDCDIKGNVGSTNAPVLLIIHGNLKISGGIIFGVVYVFQSTLETQVVGNGSVYGALISDTELKVSAGSFDIVYQKRIFDAIYGNGDDIDGISDAFKDIARVAGTWRDF